MKQPRSPGRPLNKTDYKRLAADYIDEDTANAASLRRCSSEEAAELFARKNTGTLGGILFPYRWPGTEETHLYRLRRDTPDIERTETGEKQIGKYLAPTGSRNAIYFPPVQPSELTTAALPLAITEGEKKALALYRVARHNAARAPRFLAAAISGVSNWRGVIGRTTDSNGRPQQEKGPLPDWDRLTLAERPVWIVFDRDAQTNPNVRYSRYQLAQYLTRKGARVRLVDIPADSTSKGIDEYTAANGPQATLDLFDQARATDIATEIAALSTAKLGDAEALDLLARLLAPLDRLDYSTHRATIRKAFNGRVSLADLDRLVKARQDDYQKRRKETTRPAELQYKGEPYEATQQGLVMWRLDRYNQQHTPLYLCNFSARIIADVIRDDGEEKTRALKIAAAVGDSAAELTVSAADFAKMDWPIEHLGAAANVYPTFRDHCRCAIQTISKTIETHTSYTHIGWNADNGRPMYLHAAGAIGSGGHIPNLHIDLDKRLSRYSLPEPPTNGHRRAAIRSALHMLNVAPDTITVPLLGAVFRACLGSVQCSVFLAGQSGEGKSQLAALAQQFYGPGMDAAHMPASWDSTANALEALAHKAKDALLVIDDFVPKGAAADVARLHQTADRILRAQGNASGRARMAADTSIRAPKMPRGMILATGEDLPKGHSLRARLVVLELRPGDVQWSILTDAQAAAARGEYAAALAAYIQHIAADLPGHRQHIADITAAMRTELTTTAHRRTPDNIANIAAALISFLDFARFIQAIDHGEHARLLQRAGAALETITSQQDKAQDHGEPCAAFLESITSALATGAAHLADAEGGCAGIESPNAYGWRKDAADATVWRPLGQRIGWIDDTSVYLEPIAAYKIAQANSGGDSLQLSLTTLTRRLKQRELLQSTDEARQTVTIRRTLDGAKRSVLHLHRTPTLTPENNPTFPTSPKTGTGRAADTAQNVGFFDRVKARVSGFQTVPDTRNTSSINSYAENVGNVGFQNIPKTNPGAEKKRSQPAAVNNVGRRQKNPTFDPTKNPTSAETATAEDIEL